LIYSTRPSGYGLLSGTSQAAPHVAGLAALIWAQQPALSAEQVRATMQDSAIDLGPSGRDVEYGFGLVSVPAALDLPNVTTSPTTAAPAVVTPSFWAVATGYVPGEIVVKQAPGTTAASVLNALPLVATADVQVTRTIDALDLIVLSVPVGQEDSWVTQLGQLDGVVYAERNGYVWAH
jgi:subtilisin family serine protease